MFLSHELDKVQIAHIRAWHFEERNVDVSQELNSVVVETRCREYDTNLFFRVSFQLYVGLLRELQEQFVLSVRLSPTLRNIVWPGIQIPLPESTTKSMPVLDKSYISTASEL